MSSFFIICLLHSLVENGYGSIPLVRNVGKLSSDYTSHRRGNLYLNTFVVV
jgi:hypothetical protein